MYRSEITNNSICLDGTDLNKTLYFILKENMVFYILLLVIV